MTRVFSLLLLLFTASSALAQTTTGTWTLYPPQTQTYQVSIDPPINADGSSVWSSKGVIPVQYDVLTGYGPVVFSSYESPYTYSNLDFQPSPSLTFAQLTNLSAVYTFSSGVPWGCSPLVYHLQ